MSRNEAADWLRDHIRHVRSQRGGIIPDGELFNRYLDIALATERRLTVERIEKDMPEEWHPWDSDQKDEAHGYNDALRRVRSILQDIAADDLATADVDEEAGK